MTIFLILIFKAPLRFVSNAVNTEEIMKMNDEKKKKNTLLLNSKEHDSKKKKTFKIRINLKDGN